MCNVTLPDQGVSCYAEIWYTSVCSDVQGHGHGFVTSNILPVTSSGQAELEQPANIKVLKVLQVEMQSFKRRCRRAYRNIFLKKNQVMMHKARLICFLDHNFLLVL